MIKIGDSETTVFHGDQHPAEIWQGDQKIAGFEKAVTNSEGRVEINDQPYKASLPSVTVHGEGKQDKLEGKNLFDSDKFLSLKYSDYYYKKVINGLEILEPDYRYDELIQPLLTLSAGTYTISGVNLNKYKLISTVSKKTYVIEQRNATFNVTGEDTVGIKIYEPVGTIVSNIQIERGSTPTPYEPYCGGIPAPNPQYAIEPVFLEGASVVGRGRNLFDLSIFDRPYNQQFFDLSKFIIGTELYASSNKIIAWKIAKSSGSPWSESIGGVRQDFNFTVDAKVLSLGKLWLNTIDGSDIKEADIRLGFSPTPYEPFYDGGTAPLPILRALPDGSVRDEIDVVSGTVVRRIGELKLNGGPDEKWGTNLAKDLLVLRNVPPAANVYNGLTNTINYGQFASEYSLWISMDGILRVNSAYSSVFDANPDKFREYLKTHPLNCWYALATPIIEHYPPAILRQHPGYTQLIQQGGFAPAPVEATYYQKEKEVI